MPTDELIEHMTNRYNKRRDAKDARQPIPVRMSNDEPMGLMFFGAIRTLIARSVTGRN